MQAVAPGQIVLFGSQARGTAGPHSDVAGCDGGGVWAAPHRHWSAKRRQIEPLACRGFPG
ncbi:MAG: nucleotidyltransferase domain-containing protein [Tildeniella torsiva UHER 1998/13D]|nr:nucleotidyltransferase domain-containing protein [Tildeniella torsiva UHER 1998/13D]